MRQRQQGFIALISAIVIAALLLTVTATLSFSSYVARFNLLGSEYKERSLALAEACGDTALLKLAQDPNYNPSNEVISLGSDSCTVISLQNNTPIAGQITIITQGQFQKVTTNLKTVVSSGDLVIKCWREVANQNDPCS